MQILYITIFILFLSLKEVSGCGYSKGYEQNPKRLETDFSHERLLQQQAPTGRIRIFVDYSQVTIGGQTQINTIKRIMNISANYFSKIFNVSRIERLYYQQKDRKCEKLEIPEEYVINGTIGDLGVVCGNQMNPAFVHVAQAGICSFSKINNRPIWGMIIWNNALLKYDQRGFQDNVFTGIHEMTHILGFAANAYSRYLNINPLVEDDGLYYLSTPLLDKQVQFHYNCSFFKGLPLQDQDGSKEASSHWQAKVVGTELMGPSVVKHALMSRFTLALLHSSGWYTSVNYDMSEPLQWGKNKGCDFLDINHCESDQFCSDRSFYCEADGTGIGRCEHTLFQGPCKTPKSYTNLICTNENYEYMNLNARLNAFERGGSLSRCFESDYRMQGLEATLINNRCYVAVCSTSVGSYILVCRSPGIKINAPPGLVGTLTCPSDFKNYCRGKKTCPYHCNKNGACVDGKCLCTGQTELTPTCIDVSIFNAPVGSSGGLLNNIFAPEQILNMNNLQNAGGRSTATPLQTQTVKSYSINSKCLQGTFLDQDFGICISCKEQFNCFTCNQKGCLVCDNGQTPSIVTGKCLQ